MTQLLKFCIIIFFVALLLTGLSAKSLAGGGGYSENKINLLSDSNDQLVAGNTLKSTKTISENDYKVSLLNGTFSLVAFIGIFLSLFFNRKRELLDETIDQIISENWELLNNEQSKRKFSHILRSYDHRFKKILSPKIIMLILLPFILSIVMSLVLLISYINGLDMAYFYKLISILAFLIIFIFFGLLMIVYIIPGIFMSDLPRPNDLKSWKFLQDTLGFSFREIGEKLGFIRINGVRNDKELYFEFQNYLFSPSMKYEVYLLTKKEKHRLQNEGEDNLLEHNVWSNRVFKLSDTKYQIYFTIDIVGETHTPKAVEKVALVYEEMRGSGKSLGNISEPIDFRQIAFGVFTKEFKCSDFKLSAGWSWLSEEWPEFARFNPTCLLQNCSKL